MGSTGLQGLTILHQGFDTIGFQGTGKTFIGCFDALDNRKRHIIFHEISVHMQHFFSFSNGFFSGRMGCMPFLPKKFCCPQEQTGSHFPANNIRPLVDQQWQITVGLDPVFVGIPDDGFTGWAYNKFFFQLCFRINHQLSLVVGVSFQPVMGNHSTFLGKALGMPLFFLEKGFGNKQRKIGIDMAGVLEHLVQYIPHVLPKGIAVGLYYHAAPHSRIVCQPTLQDQFIVPLRVVCSP